MASRAVYGVQRLRGLGIISRRATRTQLTTLQCQPGRQYARRSPAMLRNAQLLGVRSLATVTTHPPIRHAPANASSSRESLRLPNSPFVNWTLFPDFKSLREQCTPEKLVPVFSELVAELEREFAQRETRMGPSWSASLELVEDVEDALEKAFGVVQHLNGVKNSPALREALEEIQPMIVKLSLRMNQSQAKYEALQGLKQSAEWTSLDAAQQRIVDLTLHDMTLAGVGLPDGTPEKKRYNEIKERLSQLSTKFSNNVLDATKAFQLVIKDRSELEGCSDDVLRILAGNTQRRSLCETADWQHGPWCVTLDYPTMGPVMMSAQNRDLREQIYRANITKASQGDVNNESLINEILALKQEEASLLGFPNYAALSLSSKMAHDLPTVNSLLDELFRSSLSKGEVDMKQLTAFARDHLEIKGPIQPWDTAYVSEQYRKHLFRYSEEAIAQYFPFPHVMQGLFDVAKEVFGIDVCQASPEEMRQEGITTWHDDVTVYKVMESGKIRAWFYGDFYSRPEEKRGGAWMDLVTTRRVSADGSVRLPVAYLICNQPQPSAPGEPSLMKFRDVETLFHEFGHCLQHMMTVVDYPQASGIKGIEWDFVEVASQFMENFCSEPEWIHRLAKHQKTGEPMPQDMVDSITQSKTFLAGLAMLRQLHFSKVDLELHAHFKTQGSTSDKSVFDIDHDIAKRTPFIPRLAADRFLCSFNHIFGGGYSAGYYSYKWSETYSADAYAAFEEARDQKGVQGISEQGRKYRETILALGGATNPREARFPAKQEFEKKTLKVAYGLVLTYNLYSNALRARTLFFELQKVFENPSAGLLLQGPTGADEDTLYLCRATRKKTVRVEFNLLPRLKEEFLYIQRSLIAKLEDPETLFKPLNIVDKHQLEFKSPSVPQLLLDIDIEYNLKFLQTLILAHLKTPHETAAQNRDAPLLAIAGDVQKVTAVAISQWHTRDVYVIYCRMDDNKMDSYPPAIHCRKVVLEFIKYKGFLPLVHAIAKLVQHYHWTPKRFWDLQMDTSQQRDFWANVFATAEEAEVRNAGADIYHQRNYMYNLMGKGRYPSVRLVWCFDHAEEALKDLIFDLNSEIDITLFLRRWMPKRIQPPETMDKVMHRIPFTIRYMKATRGWPNWYSQIVHDTLDQRWEGFAVVIPCRDHTQKDIVALDVPMNDAFPMQKAYACQGFLDHTGNDTFRQDCSIMQIRINVIDDVLVLRGFHDEDFVNDEFLLLLLGEDHLFDGDDLRSTRLVSSEYTARGTLSNLGHIAVDRGRIAFAYYGFETFDNLSFALAIRFVTFDKVHSLVILFTGWLRRFGLFGWGSHRCDTGGKIEFGWFGSPMNSLPSSVPNGAYMQEAEGIKRTDRNHLLNSESFEDLVSLLQKVQNSEARQEDKSR
ncbi:hypothetical protein BZG36_02488 [Bifiguratus adelaidae]|uniref:oligopeptidase A n=1 Tax=Bifiguratus adelaidae TaxID=1938954 RepID=A0A261Y0U1_9FUNG|nr:hypothetical protein BZG36_02488 [Bifiguratus adelaidae]